MSNFNQFTIRVQTVENGEMQLPCTPDNTAVYLHHPLQHAEYDHLFWRMPEEDKPEEARGRNLGAFVWREIVGADEFNVLVMNMRRSLNWPITYRPVPIEADRRQYHEYAQAKMAHEIGNTSLEDMFKELEGEEDGGA